MDKWSRIEEDYKLLLKGLRLKKVSRRGTVREMKLFLSDDHRTLHWKSSRLGMKLGATNTIEVTRMRKYELGQATSSFNLLRDKACDHESLSIMYSHHRDGDRTLDVIVSKTTELESLSNVLKALMTRSKQERNEMSPDMMFLYEMWTRADVNGDNQISEAEIVQLLVSMNMDMPRSAVRKAFKLFDTDSSGSLDFNEFSCFLEKIRERLATSSFTRINALHHIRL